MLNQTIVSSGLLVPGQMPVSQAKPEGLDPPLPLALVSIDGLREDYVPSDSLLLSPKHPLWSITPPLYLWCIDLVRKVHDGG